MKKTRGNDRINNLCMTLEDSKSGNKLLNDFRKNLSKDFDLSIKKFSGGIKVYVVNSSSVNRIKMLERKLRMSEGKNDLLEDKLTKGVLEYLKLKKEVESLSDRNNSLLEMNDSNSDSYKKRILELNGRIDYLREVIGGFEVIFNNLSGNKLFRLFFRSVYKEIVKFVK